MRRSARWPLGRLLQPPLHDRTRRSRAWFHGVGRRRRRWLDVLHGSTAKDPTTAPAALAAARRPRLWAYHLRRAVVASRAVESRPGSTRHRHLCTIRSPPPTRRRGLSGRPLQETRETPMARSSPSDFALGVAPTLHKSPYLTGSDGVRRAARIRLDEVSVDYPGDGPSPSHAYVNLLQLPREGQPVVWASRGDNTLRLYQSEQMTGGGIAFVITDLIYDD